MLERPTTFAARSTGGDLAWFHDDAHGDKLGLHPVQRRIVPVPDNGIIDDALSLKVLSHEKEAVGDTHGHCCGVCAVRAAV